MWSSNVQRISKAKHSTARSGDVRNELSNGLVRLYRQIFGRGPVRTVTYEFDAGCVTFLRDLLVPHERVLVQSGRQDLVCEMRVAAREAERKRLISEVERVTGRAVLCDFFQMQPERDLAVELFWLRAPSADHALTVAAHRASPPNGSRYTEIGSDVERPDWPAGSVSLRSAGAGSDVRQDQRLEIAAGGANGGLATDGRSRPATALHVEDRTTSGHPNESARSAA